MSARTQHGLAGTPEYRAWAQIKDRCLNTRSPKYPQCKGKLFEPWKDFAVFYAAVGDRPSARHHLERYPNPEGDYAPGNLRWHPSGGFVEVLATKVTPRMAVLVGRRFNYLTIQSIRRVRIESGQLYYKATCECDCGQFKDVFVNALMQGRTGSCGCDKSRYTKTTGEKNYRFKGFNEIRAAFWNGYKDGAVRRNIAFDLTMEYAWALFEKQGRKCALSGVPLGFGPNRRNSLTTASLDRLDITKGYVEGNVQWVHKVINVMRNTLSVEDFIGWCQRVVAHTATIPLVASPKHECTSMRRTDVSYFQGQDGQSPQDGLPREAGG